MKGTTFIRQLGNLSNQIPQQDHLLLWYNADNVVLSNIGEIDTILDISGHNNHASYVGDETNYKAVLTAFSNGKAAIYAFNTIYQHPTKLLFNIYTINPGEFTLLYVIQEQQYLTLCKYASNYYNVDGVEIFSEIGNKVKSNTSGSGYNSILNDYSTEDTYIKNCLENSVENRYIKRINIHMVNKNYVNNVSKTSTFYAPNPALPTVLLLDKLFGDHNGPQFAGYLAELMYWDRELSEQEVATINSYLNNKYAIY